MRLAMLFSALMIGLFSSQSFAQIERLPTPELPPPVTRTAPQAATTTALPSAAATTAAPAVSVVTPAAAAPAAATVIIAPPPPPAEAAPRANCHFEETEDAPHMENGVLVPTKRKVLVCDP